MPTTAERRMQEWREKATKAKTLIAQLNAGIVAKYNAGEITAEQARAAGAQLNTTVVEKLALLTSMKAAITTALEAEAAERQRFDDCVLATARALPHLLPDANATDEDDAAGVHTAAAMQILRKIPVVLAHNDLLEDRALVLGRITGMLRAAHGDIELAMALSPATAAANPLDDCWAHWAAVLTSEGLTPPPDMAQMAAAAADAEDSEAAAAIIAATAQDLLHLDRIADVGDAIKAGLRLYRNLANAGGVLGDDSISARLAAARQSLTDARGLLEARHNPDGARRKLAEGRASMQAVVAALQTPVAEIAPPPPPSAPAAPVIPITAARPRPPAAPPAPAGPLSDEEKDKILWELFRQVIAEILAELAKPVEG